MTIDQDADRFDTVRPGLTVTDEDIAAARRYIHRHALGPADEELLADALLGPLNSHPTTPDGRRVR